VASSDALNTAIDQGRVVEDANIAAELAARKVIVEQTKPGPSIPIVEGMPATGIPIYRPVPVGRQLMCLQIPATKAVIPPLPTEAQRMSRELDLFLAAPSLISKGEQLASQLMGGMISQLNTAINKNVTPVANQVSNLTSMIEDIQGKINNMYQQQLGDLPGTQQGDSYGAAGGGRRTRHAKRRRGRVSRMKKRK
jgi:hypothetical protein